MKPGLVRPVLGALLLGLPLLPGCGEKVGTSDTSGETGETSDTSTGGVGGTTTTGVTSEVGTTGGIATVTSATHETHTTQPPECSDSGCGACPEGCTAQDECVDGEWQCSCDCATTSRASTGSEITGGGIVCGGEDPQLPELDRTCMLDRDCTVVFHQTDCCGTLVAWGLNGAAGKPFNEAEAECAAQYPACDCAPMPTAADDGKSTEDSTQIMVACMDSVCSSFVP